MARRRGSGSWPMQYSVDKRPFGGFTRGNRDSRGGFTVTPPPPGYRRTNTGQLLSNANRRTHRYSLSSSNEPMDTPLGMRIRQYQNRRQNPQRYARQPARQSQYVSPADRWGEAYEEARKANEERYQQGLDIYDQIASKFGPEGDYLAGFEKKLDRQRTKALAEMQQGAVSSGLYNTTLKDMYAKKWEEEVGAPARMQANDARLQALARALQNKAGFIERRTDAYPSYELLAQLTRAGVSPGEFDLFEY